MCFCLLGVKKIDSMPILPVKDMTMEGRLNPVVPTVLFDQMFKKKNNLPILCVKNIPMEGWMASL